MKGTGKQTIKLKTIAGLSECWVRLSADGFDASEQKKLQLVDKQTIPANHITMNLPNNSSITFRDGTGNSQDRRIYIYNAETGTQLGYYTYTRSNSNNRKAINNSDITLTNVTEDTLIYVTYTRDQTTYRSTSFAIGTAINNGVTQTMSKN